MDNHKILNRIKEAKQSKKFDFIMNHEMLDNLPKDDKITFWRTGKLDMLRHDRFSQHYPKNDKLNPNQYDSIAIVGNSGSILDSGFGEEIDDHECVIRFNTAPTVGYEEDVGSKTTFRFSIGTLTFREKDEVLLRSYRKKSQPNRDVGGKGVLSKTWLWVLTHHLSSWVQEFKDNERTICSTGFLGVMMSLIISDKVSLYGFNLPTEDKKFKYHYYNHSRYVEKSHNFLREHEIYKMLDKKLKRFQWVKND